MLRWSDQDLFGVTHYSGYSSSENEYICLVHTCRTYSFSWNRWLYKMSIYPSRHSQSCCQQDLRHARVLEKGSSIALIGIRWTQIQEAMFHEMIVRETEGWWMDVQIVAMERETTGGSPHLQMQCVDFGCWTVISVDDSLGWGCHGII